MPNLQDGPQSLHFVPLTMRAKAAAPGLAKNAISAEMSAALKYAPSGSCVYWGIPFQIDEFIAVQDQPVEVEIHPTQARWLLFLHTSDLRPNEFNEHGFIHPMRGSGQLNEKAAEYVIVFADGSEVRSPILRRHHLGTFQRIWGENCFQAVAHHKPWPLEAAHEPLGRVLWDWMQMNAQPSIPRSRIDQTGSLSWGWTQTRVLTGDAGAWVNWLWAWENPRPQESIVGFRFEPCSGLVVLSAISAGNVFSHPLRWQTRRKMLLTLPESEIFQPELDSHGLLKQIQIDLGQVISAAVRPEYPNDEWAESYNNALPRRSNRQVLVEYTAHPEACFYLRNGQTFPVSGSEFDSEAGQIRPVAPASQTVTLRVVERESGKTVAAKLHIHGESDEYLAPVDRHRILNPGWFEDFSVDFAHIVLNEPDNIHACTYISGETTIKLPLGKVYIEVSKGFEIEPIRKIVEVTPATQEIVITVEKVLPWREQGWVTADTHVHFLSPTTALLEGAAEGVNLINLLASQWGEMMTNVGDFDGQTTYGAKESGGDGEYLVRVGTENRQHVLGHISLLGYRGPMIVPMTTGGPAESALGDPIEVLLTEWARQCHQQDGLVVVPHFPNPRAEHAASIVSGDIDAIEMTSWENLYGGIDPYSLSDWYRYLNCGYQTAAVGGTDKMTASIAVGTVRTYARIDPQVDFSYEAWQAAVKRAETFVTYGPLLDFAVDGHPMGSRIEMSASGGTVDVFWRAASVTVPMTRVELVVNGDIRESQSIPPRLASGHWSVKVDRSSWLALLVRGHYPDKPEIIAAHSSPIMVLVKDSPMLAAADAVTILEQIEGSLIYLDTIGTRAEDRVYKRMRLVLESAYRQLHHRMHQLGNYHEHVAKDDHLAHH